MSEKPKPTPRGRPKVLDREHVLQLALMTYWAEGPVSVAVNEICRRANVSKPGLYREFGNDDGLKMAVLEYYQRLVVAPFFEVLEQDLPFEEVLDSLIKFTIQDRQSLGLPNGCLLVSMRTHVDDLGENAQEKVKQIHEEALECYEKWIERAKSKGEFKADIATSTAALYFDAQNAAAMRMQKEGVPNVQIGEVLKLAFAAFR